MLPAKSKLTANASALAVGKIPDTVKNGNLSVSISQQTDSLKYVINGVKSTKADFKNLDPDHILSLDIVSAELANAVLNETDNNHDVMFVTTDDSEEGKKLKVKIDRILHDHDISGKGELTVTGFSSDHHSGPTSIGTGSSNVAVSDVLIVGAPPKLFKIKPKKSRSLTQKTDTLKFTIKKLQFAAKAFAPDTVRIVGISGDQSANTITSGDNIYVVPGKAVTINPKYTTKKFRVYSDFNNETNIEHLSAKLIMIDGKEATEHDLKKLSAAAIESMSVKSGEEMTKKYGDKAKNGVVFITTKK